MALEICKYCLSIPLCLEFFYFLMKFCHFGEKTLLLLWKMFQISRRIFTPVSIAIFWILFSYCVQIVSISHPQFIFLSGIPLMIVLLIKCSGKTLIDGHFLRILFFKPLIEVKTFNWILFSPTIPGMLIRLKIKK